MDPKLIGARIAAARKRVGLSQDGLARAIGYTNGSVSRWERGLSVPDGSAIASLSDVLKVSADDLVSGEHTRAPAEDIRASPAFVELLALLNPAQHPTDEEVRWLASAPRFHRMTAGALIDALRAQRVGLTPEQQAASRAANERFSDDSVPRMKK